jgi:hypothetical protein
VNTETDTMDEDEIFFGDAARLAEDVAGNQTFSTVKPLLNFWAAFSPSREVSILFLLNSTMVLLYLSL